MHQHGGDIYKYEEIQDYSSNINLLGTPKAVMEAACTGVKLSFSYPDTQCRKLREAIGKAENIPMDHIICGNGAADLIFSLIVGKKPKKAMIPAPTFYEYEQALRAVDCEIVYHYAEELNGFLLQEDFLEKITKDLDVIFLCNPNNPTGTLIKKEYMQRILKKCELCQVLLVVDECFMDFVEGFEEFSIKDSCGTSKALFVLKAFTKLYAMPGLRLGYGLSSNIELLEIIRRVSQPWSVSIPAQLAGTAALEEKEYVKRTMELLKEEKIFLLEELKKLKLKVYGSKANYIFFRGEKKLHQACLKRGFLIRDCSNYEGLEEGYYRIVVKTHEENKQLIKMLQEVIKCQKLS